jgi:hypothetical protein
MGANILNLPHYFTQGDKKVSVRLMITVQKTSIFEQSPQN